MLSNKGLRDSNITFVDLIHSITDLSFLITNKNNEIIFMSKGTEVMFGVTLSDVYLKKATDVIIAENTDNRNSPISVKDIIQKYMGKSLWKYRHSNGTSFWAELTIRKILDKENCTSGYISFFNDVTSLTEMIHALEKNLTFTESIMDNIPTSMFSISLIENTPIYQYINKRMVSFGGGEKTDYIQHCIFDTPFFSRIHRNDVIRVKQSILKAIQLNTEWQDEFRVKFNNNEFVWVKGNDFPLNHSDGSVIRYGFFSNIDQLKNNEISYRELSQIDYLTKTYNKRYLDENFEQIWERHYKGKLSLSILFIDVDNFKEYNDTYGHYKGDLCLKEITGAISDVINVNRKNILVRYGGDEFLVILSDCDSQNAYEIAENIRKTIDNLSIPNVKAKFKKLTVSIGIHSGIPQTIDNHFKKLINKADKALYSSKGIGKNTVVTFKLDQ